MLGTWRYFLAVVVALSHIQWRLADLNPGVIAVVGFYLTSGYVMTGLLRNRYTRLADAPHFYLDRALRLLPQYYTIALLTLAWLLASGATTLFLQDKPDAQGLLNNFTIVPLNYFHFNGADRFTLIPPAWSLGAEIQFYIFLPLILRLRAVVSVISITVYVGAATGFINSELFGFRLLPGVLWFFLLGSWLYDSHHGTNSQRSGARVLLIMAIVVAGGIGLWAMGKLNLPYNRETLLGVLLALPALHLLARRARKGWDESLGNLSYGLFLNHFLVLWVVFDSSILGFWPRLAFIVVCTGFAALSQRWVERPALAWRQNMRAAAQGLAVSRVGK